MVKNIVASACTGFVLLLSVQFSAADEQVDVKAQKVAENIYMVTGKGGNLGLLVGEDGTFLIDDQYAPLTDKIMDAITSVGGDVPKFLLNTHYHGDHTGGNENFGKKGTLIFSHDNVRDRLANGSFISAFNMKSDALEPEGLPVITFSEDITFHLNGDTVKALHIPHAHTDGDAIIHFKSANVIHAGDVIFNGFYPFIDTSHGGSLRGMIEGVKRVLLLSDSETKIIPGHGPLTNAEELKNYLKMLETAYARLRQLKADGKTVEEMIAEKPLADLEEEWGDGIFKGEKWIEIIYSGI